jgi:hypothetical protein
MDPFSIPGAGPDVDQANRARHSFMVGVLADRSYESLQHDHSARLMTADVVSPQVFPARLPIEVQLVDAAGGHVPSLPGRWPVPWDNPSGAPVG